MSANRFVLLLLLVFSVGCGPKIVGGPCQYVDAPGSAVITAISDPDPAEANCPGQARVVVFDFTPDDKRSQHDWRFPNWASKGQRLTVAGGMNPKAAWLKTEGIKQGAQFKCVRREIIKGTCTPVIFEFPELDMAAAADACK